MDPLIERTIASLKRRHFNAYYAKNSAEAVEQVMKLIPAGKSVGIGGSMTVKNLGLYEKLVESGRVVWSHWLGEETFTPRQFEGEMNADYYLCSTNALMTRGSLVNIDGLGNRVAAMFHGPDKVVIVCGKNKIVEGTYDDAIARVKAMAAPQNAKRLNFTKTPCYSTGKCHDCFSSERLCCVTTIIDEPTKDPFPKEYHIVIVDEDLGY